jgi:hypothetical protein
MEWNTSPQLMAEVLGSIQPVRIDVPLRQVLTEDFPQDCLSLPISGGWGYSRTDAIVFERDKFPNPAMTDFIPLEYHIAQKIIYEELIITRPKNYRFSGIELNFKSQNLVEERKRKYDRLTFSIACWTDWHWDQLRNEWEKNDFGRRAGFNLKAHDTKRDLSQVRYEREFWFDIPEVFDHWEF